MRFSYLQSPGGLNKLYSLKATSLEQLLVWEWWPEHTFQGQGKGWGASDCPSPACGQLRSRLLDDLLQLALSLWELVIQQQETNIHAFHRHTIREIRVPSKSLKGHYSCTCPR